MRHALLALAFAASLLPGLAAAQSGAAPSVDSQRQAEAALAQSLKAAAKGSPVPRLSDPVQGPVIRAAFDERVLAKVDWTNLSAGVDLCDNTNRTMSGYMFQGVPGVDLSRPLDQLDPTTIGKLNANIIRYQDEIALGTTFVVSCMANLAGPAGDFWDHLSETDRTPVRVQGLRQYRQGLLGMYAGAIQTQTEAATSLGNKAMLLNAIVRNNTALGGALSPDERAAVVKAIDAALPRAPVTLRPDLTKVRDALKTMPCTGLCSA